MYFDRAPPFGGGNKKNEFPDAITILSLSKWLAESRAAAYVVSGDTDLASWCSTVANAFHVRSLAEFLDLYNKAEERLTGLAHHLVKKEEGKILERIKEAFLSAGFMVLDTDAEVVDVDLLSIEAVEVNVIDVSDDRAGVAVTVQIEFNARIEGPDYDQGIWDSEDKRYIYLPEFSVEKTFKERYETFIEFFFSVDEDEITDISSVIIDDGSDISVRMDDDYPYK
jgi:hypothetical protein